MTAITLSTYQNVPMAVPQVSERPPLTVLDGVFGAYRLFSSGTTLFTGINSVATKPLPSTTVDNGRNPTTNRVVAALKWFFEKVREFLFEKYYNAIYGSLYLASGACAVAGSLHDLRAYDLGPALGIVSYVELATYLTASVMGLYYNSIVFKEASAPLPPNATEEQKELATRKKVSAILGMASALGYIVNIALLLMGQMTMLAFVIGLLATLTSFTRFFLERIYWPRNPPKASAVAAAAA